MLVVFKTGRVKNKKRHHITKTMIMIIITNNTLEN